LMVSAKVSEPIVHHMFSRILEILPCNLSFGLISS
jgi:hypothetical protein